MHVCARACVWCWPNLDSNPPPPGGGNTTVWPFALEDGRCAFDWISHKDVLLWSLLRLKDGWIWETLCTAFACPSWNITVFSGGSTFEKIWKLSRRGWFHSGFQGRRLKDINTYNKKEGNPYAIFHRGTLRLLPVIRDLSNILPYFSEIQLLINDPFSF